MPENINDAIIKKTQKMLGKYIKKPALTEKLLKKPPFRFLHDVVKNIIKETNFLNGLFSEYELNSENVMEKNAKINFLNKLIDAVKNLTDMDFNVRAGKVVAGLEPENTNLLLQAIGKAIDSKVDSSEYVKKLKSPRQAQHHDSKNVSKKVSAPKKELVTKKAVPSKKGVTKDSPKANSNIKSNRGHNQKEKAIVPEPVDKKANKTIVENQITNLVTNDNKVEQIKSVKTDRNNFDNSENIDLSKKNDLNFVESKELETTSNTDIQENQPEIAQESKDLNPISSYKSAIRPKSARPNSGENIIMKKDPETPLEMTVTPSVQRPKSSLRPPSVRPSSARPGAPRLRPDSALPLKEPILMGNINVIVENVVTADDEEAIIFENNPEITEDTKDIEIPLKNKGHLVEQILEQIKDGEKTTHNVEVDWETNASQIKEGTSKEITHLRTLIQNLTKAANPLGKLMNYLHEDLDAMYSELQMWTNSKKQLYAEIHKQKKLHVESNKPLIIRLEQLNEDIKKQQQEISNLQSTILRNDIRIKELIQK